MDKLNTMLGRALIWLFIAGVSAALGQTISPAGGGGTPGGSNTYVQYNDSGVFGGDVGLAWLKATGQLNITTVNSGTEGINVDPGLIRAAAGFRAGVGGQYFISDGSDYGRGLAAVTGQPAVKFTNGSSGAGFFEMSELTAPAAGSANTARIFTQDNGSGKTQVCAIFNTGAVQCFATQP